MKRDVHAAAVRRHDDGDSAAVSTIQRAHWASDQAACGAIPQRSGQSSIDQVPVNHVTENDKAAGGAGGSGSMLCSYRTLAQCQRWPASMTNAELARVISARIARRA